MRRGQTVATHSVTIIEHDGSYWILGEHYIVRMDAATSKDLNPSGKVTPTPEAFVGCLGSCPGPETVVRLEEAPQLVMEGGGKVFIIGGIRVQQQYLWGIKAIHKNVEWRATQWYEPIYALKNGVVVGILMGLRPEGLPRA